MSVAVGETSKNLLQKFVTTKEVKKDKAYQHCVKADALRIRYHYFESIEEYKNSIKLDGENPEAFKGLGLAYKETAQLEEAVEALDTARKMTPFDKTIYYEMACCHIKLKQCCPAIKSLVTALKLDREYVKAQIKLGEAHELIEEPVLAAQIYEKIVEGRPSDIRVQNSLACVYMRMYDYKSAIKVFKKIVSINPDFSRAYLGMGVAFDKMDRQFDALKNFEIYLKQKPNSKNAEFINERMSKIRAERQSVDKSHLSLLK